MKQMSHHDWWMKRVQWYAHVLRPVDVKNVWIAHAVMS